MTSSEQRTLDAMTEMRMRSLMLNGPRWANNMGANWQYVKKDHEDVTAGFAEWVTQSNVVIFASGASLSRYNGQINKLNENSIIVATPTNVPWLIHEGVRIDFVVIADSHPSMMEKLKDYDGPIVCPPTVDKSIGEAKNQKFWFKLLMGNGQKDDPTYGIWNLMMHGMFPDIKSGYLAEHACVTNLALAIVGYFMYSRKLLGKRIILAGADYAYWKDWARIDVKLRPRPMDIDLMDWEGYQTNARMVVYKDRLLNIWAQIQGIPLYSMSEGIIHEIPQITLENVLSDEYPARPLEEEVTKRIKEFRGKFLAEFGPKIKDAE